jgi:GNAT superfamily N-acetyltransferase
VTLISWVGKDEFERRRNIAQEEWRRGEYRIEAVKRSIEHSLAFGVYKGERQVGFARVVTDFATFAWLADVFVFHEFRGQGLGKWLVETIISHPELQNLRRWMLATKDAHELYRPFGFMEIEEPERWIVRFNPSFDKSRVAENK